MRILLADDHNMVRDALKSYIERLEPEAQIVSEPENHSTGWPGRAADAWRA